MNILADESVDGQIVERLRQAGYTIQYVAELDPGIPDDSVLNLAISESALLLTADKDFGEMAFRQRRLGSGILLVRLAGLSPAKKAELVLSAIDKHGTELAFSFTVIAPEVIRIRRRIP